MSWSDADTGLSRRRLLAGLGAGLGIAALLSGCGYQPLYGTGGYGTGVSGELAAVSVDVIADRRGQILRRLLIERINPRGRPADPTWRLETQLSEVIDDIGITETDVATRANIAMTARYRLVDLGDGGVALSDRTSTVTSFNILNDEYATEVSRDQARETALRQIAEDITLRLAVFLHDRTAS